MSVYLPDIKVDRMVVPRNRTGNLKAMADVVFAAHFVAKGFKVMDGKKGLFVAMPGIREKDGRFREKFYPITKEATELLSWVILEAFRNRQKKSEPPAGSTNETRPLRPIGQVGLPPGVKIPESQGVML